MFTLVNLRRCYPCIIILAVIGLAQIYIFVMNEPFAGYVRTTFMSMFAKQSAHHEHATKTNGKAEGPVHVLLVSYARTGGSYVGDILQSHPDTFYYFEPVHLFHRQFVLESGPEAKLLLRSLFLCRTSKIPGFMYWQETHRGYLQVERNRKYWHDCSERGSCFDAVYHDSSCSEKKVIIARTSRITLRDTSELFDHFPELNLKIIYLIRDPRGTMNSRNREAIQSWCKNDVYCNDTSSFCTVLRDDLNVSCRLLRERSDDFMVLRYEDISREPYAFTNSLASFVGLEVTTEMRSFLQSHTTGFMVDAGENLHYAYNTYRDSLATSMIWRKEMDYRDALSVQDTCGKILEAYGYHVYDSVDSMKSDFYLDKEMGSAMATYCSSPE